MNKIIKNLLKNKIVKKLLNRKFNKNIQKYKNKIYFKEKNKTNFKKRKKQLKLNFNKFNFINDILKNKIIIYISFLILIILAILFLVFSSYTKIKTINIIKKDDVTNINIAYNSINDYRWKSIFNINKNNIKKSLKKYQSNIKNIEINLIFPNSMKITLESYKKLFYTNLNEKNFIVLENGSLIPFSKDIEELKNLNIITNSNKETEIFLEYKKIYEEKYIQNINYIVNEIKENIIQLEIEDLTYYTIERELHIKTKETLLIFSLENNINNQIEKLVIFNKEYKNITKTWIYYIDLRINSKVFYCPIEEKQKCEQNIKKIYN